LIIFFDIVGFVNDEEAEVDEEEFLERDEFFKNDDAHSSCLL
jgi:hypothetical protein